MGINKKLILPLSDITKLVKAKRLGLIKAIKIYLHGVKHSHKF